MSRTGVIVLAALLSVIVVATLAARTILRDVAGLSVVGLQWLASADAPPPSLAALGADPAAMVRSADSVLLWTAEHDRDDGPAYLILVYGTNSTAPDAFDDVLSRLTAAGRQPSDLSRPSVASSGSARSCVGRVYVATYVGDVALSADVRGARHTDADPTRFKTIEEIALTERKGSARPCEPVAPLPRPTGS